MNQHRLTRVDFSAWPVAPWCGLVEQRYCSSFSDGREG